MPLWPSRSRARGGPPSASGGCPPNAEGQTPRFEPGADPAPSGVSFAPEEVVARRDAAASKAHVGVRMTIRWPELAYDGFDPPKRRALLDAVLREAAPPGYALSDAVRETRDPRAARDPRARPARATRDLRPSRRAPARAADATRRAPPLRAARGLFRGF